MTFGAHAIVLGLLAMTASIPAGAQSVASDTMRVAPPALKAGQFVWYEQPAMVKASLIGDESVSIVISISAQQAYVYRGGRLIAVSTVSTGSRGRETPAGEFTILQKQVFHRSNLYSNAPMPYMQRLTWSGIAIHAGHLPGYPASHGCIRLPKAFARDLYELTQLGASVLITKAHDVAPEPIAPPPMLIAETHNLGNGAYDVVTMRGDPPPPEAVRPVSWVTGPAREIVQPIPSSRR